MPNTRIPWLRAPGDRGGAVEEKSVEPEVGSSCSLPGSGYLHPAGQSATSGLASQLSDDRDLLADR